MQWLSSIPMTLLNCPSSATLGWLANTVPRGYSCQHEAVSELNPQDLEVTLPQANLDVACEGFTTTCTEDKATKLIEDSVVTSSQIVEMLPVNMS
jgi:hypothetical protein